MERITMLAGLARRSGVPPGYVATRLWLTELIPPIAEAFLVDQIGVGHALEIAKLPHPEQQRAFEAAFHTVWDGGKETRILRPVRGLRVWIEQNILLSLDAVPFDTNDDALVPEAGSCANCPKRTGFNTLLFDAALQDSCTDGTCYHNKLAKHVERQIAEKPTLVRITTGWKAPENGVLGRNQYIALNLSDKSAKSKQSLSP
jgi:ParB family transcriptional regulator, chromosome partitioning protein